MTTYALLAFFFFFFFALLAFSKAEYVRNSEGHLIINGGTCYIKPQYVANSVIGDTNVTNLQGTCSLAVVEKSKSGAIPVRIESPLLRGTYIATENPIEISFYNLPSNPCTEIPTWHVNNDEYFQEEIVMAGDPSTFSSLVSGSFSFTAIDSFKHIYGFRFCPNPPYSCNDVVIKEDRFGNRRLIVRVNKERTVESLEFKLVNTDSHLFMVV